jgi:hypothetical protein
LNLLPLLGWALNDKGEYCFVNSNVSQDLTQREEAAREFRKFYNELATGKDRNVSTIEKFLQVRRFFFIDRHEEKQPNRLDSNSSSVCFSFASSCSSIGQSKSSSRSRTYRLDSRDSRTNVFVEFFF